MPTTFTSVSRLARKLETEPAALDARLTRMAERGLVLDVERRGRRYFTLSPVVIGFFEYTFMRQGSDLPLGELARLFDEYFFQDDRFVRSVFTGETQIGRSLAREEALVELRRSRRDPGLGAGQPPHRDGLGPRGLHLRLPPPPQPPGHGLRAAAAHLPDPQLRRGDAGPQRHRRAHQRRRGHADPGIQEGRPGPDRRQRPAASATSATAAAAAAA